MIGEIEEAAATSRLPSEPVEMGAAISAHGAIVGSSRVMQTLYKEISRIAAKPVTALIRGETDRGKELIARAIYQHIHCGWSCGPMRSRVCSSP
jgi:two-component system nitrogen regulation response regulator GlnG